MRHLKKYNENEIGGNWTEANYPIKDDSNLPENNNSNRLNSKLNEVYEIIKERVKSKGIEDFYEAETMIQEDVMKYLKSKLWEDDELSDYMKKKELGE